MLTTAITGWALLRVRATLMLLVSQPSVWKLSKALTPFQLRAELRVQKPQSSMHKSKFAIEQSQLDVVSGVAPSR